MNNTAVFSERYNVMTSSKIVAFAQRSAVSDARVLYEVFSEEDAGAMAGAMSVRELMSKFAGDNEVAQGMIEGRQWLADSLYAGETSLRALRLKQGLSQQDLALACGTSQAAIAMIENGKRDARATTIARMAKALGVDRCALFGILTPECGNENER